MFRLKSEKAVGWGLVLCSVVLSFGGVAVVAWTSIDCTLGGRGGDIAVALTLAAFFLRKDLDRAIRTAIAEADSVIDESLKDFQNPSQEGLSIEPISALNKRIDALEVSRTVSVNSQKKMDRYVACAAVIGTLVGGFGDLLACTLKSSSGFV